MEKDILIVGAGISGLSAGCYARMNGYSTAIYEMHDLPGGLCTAWERKGYTFDISMHMLTASRSGPIHRMWEELGIPAKFTFHYHKLFNRIEGMDRVLEYTSDRKSVMEQMVAISPEDARLSRKFVRSIFGPDMMRAASLNPKAMKNMWDSLRAIPFILPLMGVFMKYNKISVQDFAGQFRDPFLREAVRMMIDVPGWPMPQFPMIALAGFIKSGMLEAGVPMGGSQQVVFHMANLFESMGGELHYKQKVSGLVLDGDRVAGIRFEDGTEERAGHIIWAGDGHTLLFDLLGGKYLDDTLRNMYENWIPVKSILHVMMGVNMDLSKEPHRIIRELDEPVTIANQEHRWMAIIHHCFDPSSAPAGKSAVEVWYDTDCGYWEELAKDRKAYLAEKKRIADFTVSQLEKRWPGFRSSLEVLDVPTPATYRRYTGNWQGSPDGWYVTTENLMDMEPIRTLPGLAGLTMVGQWTAPFTGTVIAALTGRQAIQLMCREAGKKFSTTVN